MTVHGSASIEQAAYSLCKAVISAPGRGRVQSLLRAFEFGERGQLGYYAPRFGGQFGGYLALDAARSELNPKIGALPPIGAEERQLLVGCHLELVALNAACVASIAQLRPGVAEVVDPYGSLDRDALLTGEAARGIDSSVLPADLVSHVADAFRRSPVCAGVRKGAAPFPITIEPPQLAAAVDDLDRRLRRAGAAKGSDDLATIALQFPPSDLRRALLEYFAAVAGIRAALRVLDQLVFQAFQIDRLPTASSDNIVAVDGPSLGVAERLVTVTLQPTPEFFHPKPTELIYFASPRGPGALDGLAEIVSTRSTMSRETGSLVQLALHLVDGNLNPSPLYQHLASASG